MGGIMIIVNSNDVEYGESKGEIVKTGPVLRKVLVKPEDADGFGIVSVTFKDGARLNFHIHTHEQILYFTEGTGIVADREKEYVVKAGTSVYIPPGEDHWHGAAPGESCTHIAVYRGDTTVNP